MTFLKSIFHLGTIIGALLAAAQVIETSTYATSAPQQAAGMAMALAYVVIPYCFARAVEQLTGR